MDALKVGFPLYKGFDSLDVLGPFQTFTFAGMDCYLVAQESSSVESVEGVHIPPRTTFKDCPPLDVLFVPGGATPVDILLKGPQSCQAAMSRPKIREYFSELCTHARCS
jgi:cyclohexyl-isocyanide hydratase